MYRSIRWPLAAAVSFVLHTGSACADETDLREIVVTASWNRNLLDIAQPTAVLGGDDLARQRSASLGETLSNQLGVSSSYFGPTSSRPVIRGLGGYRVQTLQDGLATLDVGSLSDDHAVSVDPSLAEQLEVLKGPATLLHGSGAVGGLINIVTPRIPQRASTPKIDGFAELRGGTAADERAGVVSGSLYGTNAAIHIDGFKSTSDDVGIPGSNVSRHLFERATSLGETIESHDGSIPNTSSDSKGGALGGSWWNDDMRIGASASRYENTYGIPSEDTAYIAMKQDRYQAEANWSKDSGWLRDIALAAVVNDYEHTEFEAPGEPGTVFKQNAFEVRASASHVHTDTWRGSFGVQLTHIDFAAIGDEAFVPASVTENLGVFALEEFTVDAWTFNVGARLERQTIEPDHASGLSDFDEAAISGAAGAVFKINDADTFSVNITHSARHPQATELYANGPHVAAQRFERGDPTLDTEMADTIDLALRRNGEGLNWLIGAFYNRYDNFVFATPTGRIVDDFAEVQYMQDAARLFGFESELWIPLADKNGTWRLRLMSDYTRGERSNGEPLPQMPPLRIGAGVHFDRNNWHASIEGIRYAEQDRLAPNELPTDSYLMANADVSWRIDNTLGAWMVFIRGTNLLDEEARQHTSALKDLVPLPGRSLNAGVRLSF